MDNQFQTSFIPKKPLVSIREPSSSSRISLFSTIAVVIFIVFLASAAGVYLWKRYLLGEIKNMSASVTKARAALEPSLVNDLVRLNNRIEGSKALLKGHVALSPFFSLLETLTLQSLRFTSFGFSVNGEKVVVTMSGAARSFATIALQSDVFGRNNKYIHDPLFSDLNLDKSGNVIFKFTATIDPSLVSYEKSIADEVAPSLNE